MKRTVPYSPPAQVLGLPPDRDALMGVCCLDVELILESMEGELSKGLCVPSLLCPGSLLHDWTSSLSVSLTTLFNFCLFLVVSQTQMALLIKVFRDTTAAELAHTCDLFS